MISPKSRQRKAFLLNLFLVLVSFKYADEFDFFTAPENFRYMGIFLVFNTFIATFLWYYVAKKRKKILPKFLEKNTRNIKRMFQCFCPRSGRVYKEKVFI